VRLSEARKNASLLVARNRVAKNATWPFVFAGVTTGSDSTPKCSNVPPPGAGSPATATARIEGWALTAATARTNVSTTTIATRGVARMA